MRKNDFLKHIYRYIIPLSVVIICAYALVLRILSLNYNNLWVDELYWLKFMEGSFSELLKAIPKEEPCSYLCADYFIIYPFFKIFSYNKWGLAIPDIIATIIGFYLLYLICKRYFHSVWAYIITFAIVCFNATLIRHATELRPYAMLPTLALGTFYLFQKMADSDFELDVPKKIWAAVFFILVIWFHVYGVIMFAGSFMFFLVSGYKERRHDGYFSKAVSFVIMVLCFAMPFWLYCVLGPHGIYTRKEIHVFDYIPSPLTNIIGFLKGIFCNMVGYKKLYPLFIAVIIPFLFHYKDRYRQLLFLLFNILFPVGVILFLDIVTKYWFLQRQFIFVMPLFAFFLGWAWDSIFTLRREKKSIP